MTNSNKENFEKTIENAANEVAKEKARTNFDKPERFEVKSTKAATSKIRQKQKEQELNVLQSKKEEVDNPLDSIDDRLAELNKLKEELATNKDLTKVLKESFMTDLLAQKEDGIETPILKHSRYGEGGYPKLKVSLITTVSREYRFSKELNKRIKEHKREAELIENKKKEEIIECIAKVSAKKTNETIRFNS
mgnify:CR=1 FL=1|tara:strand:- start:3201 stop:3776 length:576 start_codon:yes stop_codon:yes gene_type:complete